MVGCRDVGTKNGFVGGGNVGAYGDGSVGGNIGGLEGADGGGGGGVGAWPWPGLLNIEAKGNCG